MMAEKNVFQNFAGAPIWKYFKRSLCGKLAQCDSCSKQLKCEGGSTAVFPLRPADILVIWWTADRYFWILRGNPGSTKGLHIHLRAIHKIDLSKRTDTKETSAEVYNSEVPISNAHRKLDIYMNEIVTLY